MQPAPIGNAYIKLIEKELAPLQKQVAALEAEVTKLKLASAAKPPSLVQRYFRWRTV